MKKIIILLFIFLSGKAIAQQDSSQLFIRLNLNQKHLAYMGFMLSQRNTLNDRRVYDTLSRRIGSGLNPDSASVGNYRADYVLKFITGLGDEPVSSISSYWNELISGRSGWIGLQTQLNVLANNGNAGAIWLRRELVDLLARKQAPFTDKLNAGVNYLKTTIEY